MKKILLLSALSLVVATGVMGVAGARPNEHANAHAFGANGHGANKVTVCNSPGNSGKSQSHSVSVNALGNGHSGWSSCGGGGFSAATFAGGLAETR